MKLPVNEFLVKIAILLALVGLSTCREVATAYPHATVGYYVGNAIPWLLGVAVVGSIVGLLVWAVVVLLSDAKNKDIGRALVLGGIYLLTIWAIWAQGDAIQQFKDSTGLGGKIFNSIFGELGVLYLLGLSAAIPGVGMSWAKTAWGDSKNESGALQPKPSSKNWLEIYDRLTESKNWMHLEQMARDWVVAEPSNYLDKIRT